LLHIHILRIDPFRIWAFQRAYLFQSPQGVLGDEGTRVAGQMLQGPAKALLSGCSHGDRDIPQETIVLGTSYGCVAIPAAKFLLC
jgi:hypothetical protein